MDYILWTYKIGMKYEIHQLKECDYMNVAVENTTVGGFSTATFM
jgi:hypothetical protein